MQTVILSILIKSDANNRLALLIVSDLWNLEKSNKIKTYFASLSLNYKTNLCFFDETEFSHLLLSFKVLSGLNFKISFFTKVRS